MSFSFWEPCDRVCDKTFAPACGSDGLMYSNSCFLELATCKSDGAITKLYDGACKEGKYKKFIT